MPASLYKLNAWDSGGTRLSKEHCCLNSQSLLPVSSRTFVKVNNCLVFFPYKEIECVLIVTLKKKTFEINCEGKNYIKNNVTGQHFTWRGVHKTDMAPS